MKLLFCPYCQDVQKLRLEMRTCACGKSWGFYEDDRAARIGGSAIPLGIGNRSLVDALEARPETGEGSPVHAFVIPKDVPEITDDGDGRTKQFRGKEARQAEFVELILALERSDSNAARVRKAASKKKENAR